MIWFVSDTHYSHTNIVRGLSRWTDKSGCRDFLTMHDHNQWIVDTINCQVNRKDTLYHLGDWSFGGTDMIKEFRDRINCEKVHIILGNHDHNIAKGDYRLLFESIKQYDELTISKLQLVLMHYPISHWNNMEKGSIHLHGHVHGQAWYQDGRVDVGMDAQGLKNLDQLAAVPRATISRHASIEGGNQFGSYKD